jgi:hypothetical protein
MNIMQRSRRSVFGISRLSCMESFSLVSFLPNIQSCFYLDMKHIPKKEMSTDVADEATEEGTDGEPSPPLPTGSGPRPLKWVTQKPRRGFTFNQEGEGMTSGMYTLCIG